jgi:deazaflavin-dependent oxidoreductase (nitroreductase family)
MFVSVEDATDRWSRARDTHVLDGAIDDELQWVLGAMASGDRLGPTEGGTSACDAIQCPECLMPAPALEPVRGPPCDERADAVSLEGEYGPSTTQWVREQVEVYESSGGTRGTTLWDTGWPVVVMSARGAKTGKIRKVPVMRVEHEGRYAVVGSLGGSPRHPLWYFNVKADPHVELQDGPVQQDMTAHEATGEERAEWWRRAVAVFPRYAEMQKKTSRQFPVFVLEPVVG